MVNVQPQKKELFINKRLDTILLSCFVIWFFTFNQGITSAYSVWVTSDIFNHCLFIIPISLYFIWQKRFQLAQSAIQPELKWLAASIPLSLLYIFGSVGDIALFMHIASFCFLPIIFLTLLGLSSSKIILFPLLFILFTIPVGESLIPLLQSVAASIAVFILELANVPTFVNGLFIDIPNGRFLVAEACSGISFFIVSIVFGCLFAYTTFHSTKRKLAFVLLSFIVPIVANGIRVFGIIYIAHISDMEYAVGADHLIYGWFFYCLILILLILIGNRMRDKAPEHAQNPTQPIKTLSIPVKKLNLAFASICLILVIQFIWVNSTQDLKPGALIELKLPSNSISVDKNYPLHPKLINADKYHYFQINQHGTLVDVYIAQYKNYSNGELVSGINRLYSQDYWSLVKQTQLSTGGISTHFSEITSPSGNKRINLAWYHTKFYTGHSAIRAKLIQTFSKVLQQDNSGFRIIVSTPIKQDSDKVDKTITNLKQASSSLIEWLEQHYEP